MPDRNDMLAIVNDDFELGFKLTGIDTQGFRSAQQAKTCLEQELVKQRYSLILIDENFLLSFDAYFYKKVQRSTKPLVMAIPLKQSFKQELEAEDHFLKMVQSAIGYEIRIK